MKASEPGGGEGWRRLSGRKGSFPISIYGGGGEREREALKKSCRVWGKLCAEARSVSAGIGQLEVPWPWGYPPNSVSDHFPLVQIIFCR